MTSIVPTFKLSTGAVIPAIGVGCWMGVVGESQRVVDMVKSALRIGYRHIDTASNYGNEESVGQAIRESMIPREEIFLTTKLTGEDHGHVEEALNCSMRKLGVQYVDLFLVHWPQALLDNGEALPPDQSPTIQETWRDMEKLFNSGKARAIGVSNFSIKTLTKLLEHASVVPMVNQVETHPCLPQVKLIEYCHANKILVTAYSPIGKHKYATDPAIMEIARSKRVTEAQILLSWAVARGTAAIPKSEKIEHLERNITLVQLTPEDKHALNMLHEKPGMHRSVCGFHSPALGGSCFGWTYDLLGWDMIEGGIVPTK
ncbi:Aldo/keto reductase [Collybia nuda]|uniref:Aldo/keto reductase n=1 Tax=Collybia nuda TaxID=64659 RepID=A0A9P6CAU0_9AGAR|nr:Aldo/keto reductase [Collybia nuda]